MHVHSTTRGDILIVLDTRPLCDVYLYDQAAQEGSRERISKTLERSKSQLIPWLLGASSFSYNISGKSPIIEHEIKMLEDKHGQ